MSYLISAWPTDKKAGPVEQTRCRGYLSAMEIAKAYMLKPAVGAVSVSVFDELTGCVVFKDNVIP
jgi:hypothetical protein